MDEPIRRRFRPLDDFDSEADGRQQERQRRHLERRLEALMASEDRYYEASARATEGARFQALRSFGGEGRSVPSSWVGRGFKGEPRPVLARLMSRKSEPLVTLLVLLWLWDQDPWDASVRERPWNVLLPQVHSAENERGLRRTVGRALDIITQECTRYDAEMRAWKRAHRNKLPPVVDPSDPDRIVRAWTTPQRPQEISIPATFYTNGWHLALDKTELAWWLAGRLITISGMRPQSRMKDRYLGFSKHVTGTAWLPFNVVLDHVDLAKPAQLWMARLILEQLGNRAYGTWPRLEFNHTEYPQLIVTGTTRAGHPAILIGTNEQWHLYETHVSGRDVDVLARRAGSYPWLASRQELRTQARRDRRGFHVFGPGTLTGSKPLLSVFEPDNVWGSPDLYAKG